MRCKPSGDCILNIVQSLFYRFTLRPATFQFGAMDYNSTIDFFRFQDNWILQSRIDNAGLRVHSFTLPSS